MAESEEVQKSLLIKVKEESEKFGLRLPQHSENKGHGIQSHRFMGNRWGNCGKFFKRCEYQTTLPVSWETCKQVNKQQLALDMEQQTGSK